MKGLGGKIVAETFVRMLKRDSNSYLNTPGFSPILPSKVAGDFTVADMMIFAGVTQPWYSKLIKQIESLAPYCFCMNFYLFKL